MASAKGWDEAAPERKAEILKVVRLMRRKPRNGGLPQSYQSIADRLNAEGMRPLRGGEWSAQLVRSFHSRAA